VRKHFFIASWNQREDESKINGKIQQIHLKKAPRLLNHGAFSDSYPD
jgi:hypothetical protein